MSYHLVQKLKLQEKGIFLKFDRGWIKTVTLSMCHLKKKFF